MKKIIRVLRALFFPYFPSCAEKTFIEKNRPYWQDVDAEVGVLVETYLNTPAALLEKFIIAKLVERQFDVAAVVLLNSQFKRSSEAYALGKSFGISRFVCLWRMYFRPTLFVRCLAKSLQIFKTIRTGEQLIGVKLDGTHVGDLLYDTLIRFRPRSYTVEKLEVRKHFRLIFRGVLKFYITQQLFRRYRVRALVTSHTVYAEFGIACRIAHAHGAAVCVKDMDVFRLYRPEDNIYEHFLKVKQKDLEDALDDVDVVAAADDYFARRLSGDIKHADVQNAYGGKRIYNKSDFLSLFDIRNSKKNVFVLAHAFSDAPHVGGRLAFADYYAWLRETIKTLAENKRVNVFIKPHPSSYMWGEKGAVEVLLEQLGTTDIYVTPSDLNTSSISEIADYVVTARGTAGLEYSGFGIPAITCGEGYYSGFGIAYERFCRTSYLSLLLSIDSLAPLSPAVSARARVLLYLTFGRLVRSRVAPQRHIYPGDNVELLTPQHFKEMTERLLEQKTFDDPFTAMVIKTFSDAL